MSDVPKGRPRYFVMSPRTYERLRGMVTVTEVRDEEAGTLSISLLGIPVIRSRACPDGEVVGIFEEEVEAWAV